MYEDRGGGRNKFCIISPHQLSPSYMIMRVGVEEDIMKNIFLSPPMYMKMVVGGDIIYEDGGVGRYYAVVILCNFNKYFMDKLSDCKLEKVVMFLFSILGNLLGIN